jgi:trehalose 6-phosphate phosphatase
MTTRICIDPRLHDAVIFGVPLDDSLSKRLSDAGVPTSSTSGEADADQFRETARELGVRPERSAVVVSSEDGVTAARNGGFALVIGLGHPDGIEAFTELGADAIVADLSDVEVRTGDKRMSEIPNALVSYRSLIDGLRISKAGSSRRPAVCLDYDGTLSEIVPDPEAATLVDGAAQALTRLAQRCPVAILSGRDLADVRNRVGVPGIWYAGSHGFESVAPDGSYRQNEAAAAAVPVLEQAAADLREALSGIDGNRVEHKRFAVAVHYRDVAADRVGQVVATTHRLGRRLRLRVTNGRKVVELRPDVDWNKGTTLAWICQQIPATVLPMYIGDDLTDEDAFDAVKSDGIGILVRHTEDGDRPSAARYTLESPAQTTELLARLADDLPLPKS